MFSRLKPTRSPRTPVPAAVPDPQALSDQLTSARRRLALLEGDATDVLSEVPSEQELAAARELAEYRRAALREMERAELSDQLAASEAIRQANKTIREADIRDAVDARKALAEQRRAASPASRVAELHRYNRWTRYGCAAIICAGLVWSAINVQQNMAPGGSGDPMFWVSFLVDGMISGLLIILALGAAKVQESGNEPSTSTRVAEFALFGFALAMNTYPHLREHHFYAAILHGIAPVMIGASMLVLHSLGKDYAVARELWTAKLGPGDTVHLPQVPTVHRAPATPRTEQPGTEHRAPSYQSALTQTVHRAVEAPHTEQPTEQGTEFGDFATEHLPVYTDSRTVQTPSTEQPGTEHRALVSAAVLGASAAVHGAHHTTPSATPGAVARTHAEHPRTQADEATAVTMMAADTAEQSADTEQDARNRSPLEGALSTPGERLSEETVQAIPSTEHIETVQSPSTEQHTEQPATEQDSARSATEHPTEHTEQHTEQLATEHRAPNAATGQRITEDDTEMLVLAAEVHGRLSRTKFSVEDVARVLTAHRRHGLGVDRIAREKIGPHREVTKNWISIARDIERERNSGMASVISLR